MTDDKKVIFVISGNSSDNNYGLTVMTTTGQTYTQSDYAGIRKFSTIRNNVPPVWSYGVSSVDAAGAGTYLSYTDSRGGATPANFTRVLSASGVVTDPADDTAHGQMSYNKDITVRTNTNAAGRYGIVIGFSASATYTTLPQIAAGYLHTVAVKSDGTVWAWGYNLYGQLGDGTTTERRLPVQVTTLSGIAAVAAGTSHTVALKSDNTVWTWGYNGDGELGDGTTISSSLPLQVTALSGVAAVAAGNFHSVAVKSDNTVWAWGYNVYGQLGDGTTTDRSLPVPVISTPGPFIMRIANQNASSEPPNAGAGSGGGCAMSPAGGPVTLSGMVGNWGLLVVGLAVLGWRRRIRKKRRSRVD
jgi:hypothetical protein